MSVLNMRGTYRKLDLRDLLKTLPTRNIEPKTKTTRLYQEMFVLSCGVIHTQNNPGVLETS